MVKLNDGASDTTLEQHIIAMSRIAIEPTARGAMVQQGCLSVCIQMSKGVSNPNFLYILYQTVSLFRFAELSIIPIPRRYLIRTITSPCFFRP